MTAFLHTELLESLKQEVSDRMDKHREEMAKGVAQEQYWKLVGAHREGAALINLINDIEKKGDEDGEGDDQRPD